MYIISQFFTQNFSDSLKQKKKVSNKKYIEIANQEKGKSYCAWISHLTLILEEKENKNESYYLYGLFDHKRENKPVL